MPPYADSSRLSVQAAADLFGAEPFDVGHREEHLVRIFEFRQGSPNGLPALLADQVGERVARRGRRLFAPAECSIGRGFPPVGSRPLLADVPRRLEEKRRQGSEVLDAAGAKRFENPAQRFLRHVLGEIAVSQASRSKEAETIPESVRELRGLRIRVAAGREEDPTFLVSRRISVTVLRRRRHQMHETGKPRIDSDDSRQRSRGAPTSTVEEEPMSDRYLVTPPCLTEKAAGNHMRRSSGKRRAAILALGAAILISAGCGETAGPTAPQSPTTSRRLPVPYVAQQTPVWCWAACSEMVLAYKGSPEPQCGILSDWFQFPCCLQPAACATTAPLEIIQATLAAHGVRSTRVPSPLPLSSVKAEIDAGRPLILAYRGSFSGHVVVLFGYDAQGNVAIHDPIYGSYPSVPFGAAFSYGGQLSWAETLAGIQ